MLDFSLLISLPGQFWKVLYSKSGNTPFPNKYWELEVCRTSDLIGFTIGLTTKRDHAGLTLRLMLVGHMVEFQVYDRRHWDDESDRWDEND